MSVLYEIRDGVAIITLNRPEAMNSLNPEMREGLWAAWRNVAADDTVMCAILTGAGDGAFCAGADLKSPMPSESVAELKFGGKRIPSLLAGMEMDKPIICAINGYAMGGGMELALACDIRIASDNAEFALSEVRVGSIPGAGGTQRLPRTISQSDAMLMLLTGDRFPALDALLMGIVSKVVSRSELMDAAIAVASRIARNAPLSVRAIKHLVREGSGIPLDRALALESHVLGILRDTEDRAEGRKAFREKRSPVFHGK